MAENRFFGNAQMDRVDGSSQSLGTFSVVSNAEITKSGVGASRHPVAATLVS